MRVIHYILICIHYSFFQNTDHSFKKTKFHLQTTKKQNCTAFVTIREIIQYPEFKVRY